jgi:hypothetical protein
MTNELITTRRVPALPLSFADVFFHSQYTLPGVESWKQVATLGQQNIAALIMSARSNEKSLTATIGRLKEKLALLDGKTGDDIKEMAKEYENPTITEIGKMDRNSDPEPLDAASIIRANGATTFNMCGWCKHSSGGLCRYNYSISTSCSLLDDSSPKTKFNTPCLLQPLSAEELAQQSERLRKEIRGALEGRERVRSGIRLLLRLKRLSTVDKPYLMSLRSYNHFKVGEELMVYVGNFESKTVEGDWVPAVCISGEGMIGYLATFPFHDNFSSFEGRGGSMGKSRPEVISRSTFCYLNEAFQSDLEFVELWVRNASQEHFEGFDSEAFKEALRSGNIAQPSKD